MPVAIAFGFMIGFVLAMPPGPVAITAIKMSLDKGSRHAILVGLGTGLLDFLYCTAAIFATSAVVDFLVDFADKNPLPILIFQLGVIAGIVTFGIIQIKSKKRKKSGRIPKPKKGIAKLLEDFSHKGPFLLGVAVAIANMANPTFIPSLAVMTTWAQSLKIFEVGFWSNVFFSLGFGLGNFGWIYVLSRVIVHYKSRMSEDLINKIHKFAGISLITVGTLLGYRVVTFTPWSDILRIAAAF